MSDEIKNFREAVAKFDELQLELSDLKEALETNFIHYKNVSDISSDISQKNQAVLESINTLQINAENSVNDAIDKAEKLKAQMAEYYSAEYSKTKSNLVAMIGTMNKSINALEEDINRDIQSAINKAHIDTSALSQIIDDKIEGIDLTALEDFTKKVNAYITSHSDDFTAAAEVLNSSANTLDDTVSKINTSTDRLNANIKKINWLNYGVVAIVSLGAGLIIGGGGMFFKAFDLVDYAYKEDYKESLAQLEAKKASIDELPKLYQYLRDNEIEVHFGIFDDTQKPYLAIDKDDTMVAIIKSGMIEQKGDNESRCFVRDNGQTVIRLDEDKVIGLNIPKE